MSLKLRGVSLFIEMTLKTQMKPIKSISLLNINIISSSSAGRIRKHNGPSFDHACSTCTFVFVSFLFVARKLKFTGTHVRSLTCCVNLLTFTRKKTESCDVENGSIRVSTK